MEIERTELSAVRRSDSWIAWPVSWTGLWVGALATLTVGLVIGLIGFAVGAHQIGTHRIVRWSDIRFLALIFSICGAFFSFAVGGWAAARIPGIRRPEPAMLHGAIVWALVVPMMLVLGTFGITTYFGGWWVGLAATPGWATTPSSAMDAAAMTAARNSALAALTSILVGLMGAVLGGWLASGERMVFTQVRIRERVARRDLAA